MMASSVAAAIIIGTIVLRAETKMAPRRMTLATMDEIRYSAPSILLSDPLRRKCMGKGVEDKGGGRRHERRW